MPWFCKKYVVTVFRCCFRCIWEKKLRNVSLWDLSFTCCTYSVYWNACIPRILPALKNSWLHLKEHGNVFGEFSGYKLRRTQNPVRHLEWMPLWKKFHLRCFTEFQKIESFKYFTTINWLLYLYICLYINIPITKECGVDMVQMSAAFCLHAFLFSTAVPISFSGSLKTYEYNKHCFNLLQSSSDMNCTKIVQNHFWINSVSIISKEISESRFSHLFGFKVVWEEKSLC